MESLKSFIALILLGAVATLIFFQQRTIQKQDELATELYKLVNIQEDVIDASQEVIELQEKIMSMNY